MCTIGLARAHHCLVLTLPGATPEILIALSEFIWWAIAVDEQKESQWETVKSTNRQDGSTVADLVNGLRFARNRSLHQLVNTAAQGGRSYPMTFPMTYPPASFASAIAIRAPKEKHNNHLNKYIDHVEGQPVREIADEIFQALSRAYPVLPTLQV